MLTPSDAARAIDGTMYGLGRIDMRLLATSDETEGAFAIAEFTGAEGAWTVPHIHADSLEAFFVIDGGFVFTLGDDDFEANAGQFVLIPRRARHMMRAETGGGRFLTIWTPGGLEQMFVELSRLSPDSLRDPAVRKETSSRFDSIPVA